MRDGVDREQIRPTFDIRYAHRDGPCTGWLHYNSTTNINNFGIRFVGGSLSSREDSIEIIPSWSL